MNNQKIINEIINEIKDLLSKLEQELKNIKINDDMDKFKNFIPKDKERYFYLDIDGTIGSFENTNSLFDKVVLNRHRVFKTKEHAEEYRDFMDMLNEKSRPFIHDENNYLVYYHHKSKQVDCELMFYSQHKELYFDKKVAEQLIKDYPNELKHWYLEVPYEN